MTIVTAFQRQRTKGGPHKGGAMFHHSKFLLSKQIHPPHDTAKLFHPHDLRIKIKLHPVFSLPDHIIQYDPQQKAPKRVRFAPTATVTPIQRDKDDLHNAWYKENHYRYFEASNKRTVEQCRTGDKLEQNTTVGLEQYLDGKHHQRRIKLVRHCAMVLEVCRAQRDFGIFDEHMVREISERFSKSFVSDAQARAARSHKLDT